MNLKKFSYLTLAMLTIFTATGCSRGNEIKYSLKIKYVNGVKLENYAVSVLDSNGKEVSSGKTDKYGMYSWMGSDKETYTAQLTDMKKGYRTIDELTFNKDKTYVNTTITSSIIEDELPSSYIYQPGDIAYDYTFTDYKDASVKYKLTDLMNGKSFICLNFFYVGCGPCEREFPLIESTYQRYKDKMSMLAIDVYKDQEAAMIDNYRSKLGVTFPMCKDMANMMTYMFDLHYAPTTAIIDKYGRIDFYSFKTDTDANSWERKFAKYADEDYLPDEPTWDEKTW